MAERCFLEKLEDHLKCLICHDTYKHPKILDCNHVFCRDCLEPLVYDYTMCLFCPACRSVTELELDEAWDGSFKTAFQTAFQTNSVLDVLSECLWCKKMKLEAHYCSQHQYREAELYCDECEDRICVLCTCTIEQHHGHRYNLVSEILKPVEQQLSLICQLVLMVQEPLLIV